MCLALGLHRTNMQKMKGNCVKPMKTFRCHYIVLMGFGRSGTTLRHYHHQHGVICIQILTTIIIHYRLSASSFGVRSRYTLFHPIDSGSDSRKKHLHPSLRFTLCICVSQYNRKPQSPGTLLGPLNRWFAAFLGR